MFSEKSSQSKKSAPKKITENYLKNAGLYYLQRFPASCAHFQFIMMRKIHKSIAHHTTPSLEEAEIRLKDVTSYFEELGFLNDKNYALGLSGSLFRKGLSPKRIEGRLKEKGIESQIIKDCLDEVLPDNAERISGLTLLKRRRYGVFSSHKAHKDRQEPQKILGILARAGFSYQTAQEILAFSLKEAEDILDTV